MVVVVARLVRAPEYARRARRGVSSLLREGVYTYLMWRVRRPPATLSSRPPRQRRCITRRRRAQLKRPRFVIE